VNTPVERRSALVGDGHARWLNAGAAVRRAARAHALHDETAATDLSSGIVRRRRARRSNEEARRGGFHRGHLRCRASQKSRSDKRRRSRGCFRRRTATCCRSARFSGIRSDRLAKIVRRARATARRQSSIHARRRRSGRGGNRARPRALRVSCTRAQLVEGQGARGHGEGPVRQGYSNPPPRPAPPVNLPPSPPGLR
jgi:hypothetical protein